MQEEKMEQQMTGELHAVRAKGKWRKNIINVELGLLNLIADIGARKAIMEFQSP